jgi:actin-related protein 2
MTTPPLVLDTGTGFIKIGFAGSKLPQQSVPGIIGRPQYRFAEEVDGVQLKSEMFGQEASTHRNMLELFYPMAEGMVKDWDDMTKLWAHSFEQVGLEDLAG